MRLTFTFTGCVLIWHIIAHRTVSLLKTLTLFQNMPADKKQPARSGSETHSPGSSGCSALGYAAGGRKSPLASATFSALSIFSSKKLRMSGFSICFRKTHLPLYLLLSYYTMSIFSHNDSLDFARPNPL
jgi:hypothetical protein